jgi:hypothetical protein
VMFSLLSLEGMRLVLRKRDIVDDRMTGRRRGRQRVTAEMLLVEDIPQAYTHQHTLLQRGSFLFAICKAFWTHLVHLLFLSWQILLSTTKNKHIVSTSAERILAKMGSKSFYSRTSAQSCVVWFASGGLIILLK